jgi:hypothetical protein
LIALKAKADFRGVSAEPIGVCDTLGTFGVLDPTFKPGVTTTRGRSGRAALKQAAMKGQLAEGAGVHRTKGRWPGECTISFHHGESFQWFHGWVDGWFDCLSWVLTLETNVSLLVMILLFPCRSLLNYLE